MNDSDLLSMGGIDGVYWEARICDDVVKVWVYHEGGAEQWLAVPAAVADALGPALVAGAARLRNACYDHNRCP